jgi:hypothetical protein
MVPSRASGPFATPPSGPCCAAPAARVTAGQLDRSVAGGYSFLNQMMDRYAAGSTAATGRTAYLGEAEAIGNWVQAHCHDTRGLDRLDLSAR